MADSSVLLAAIVLAAGSGTRMKSVKPKVLHEIAGKTMLEYALLSAKGVSPEKILVTVRHAKEQVSAEALRVDESILLAQQGEISGTGQAVKVALDLLPKHLQGSVLVSYGDVPMLGCELISAMFDFHRQEASCATILTASLVDPTGYGRVKRNSSLEVVSIVEQVDATVEELKICEVNSGIYIFDLSVLRAALSQVVRENSKNEVYLTDVINIIHKEGRKVSSYLCDDVWQILGVNDRVQLAAVAQEMNRRIVTRWMENGVTIVDPANTWIDETVLLESDVTIFPGTQLYGKTRVAFGARIGPDTTLTDVVVGKQASVVRTHGVSSYVGDEAQVGPFAYLRAGTSLGVSGKIGAFVETKNVEIGFGTKISHLSYVGDATLGAESNIGACTVFANYDGVRKHHTFIGSGVKVGAHTTFVAPVEVADGAFTGAGTVVRKNVPLGSLAVNVSPQRNIVGWVEKNRNNLHKHKKNIEKKE